MSEKPLAVFFTMDEALGLLRAVGMAKAQDSTYPPTRMAVYKVSEAIARRRHPSGDHYLGEANEGFEA